MEKYAKNVYFLVDTDFTHVQVALHRVRELRPLTYEVNIDEASIVIIAFLVEERDKNEL